MKENLIKLTDSALSIAREFKFVLSFKINRDSTIFKFQKGNLATSVTFSNQDIENIVDIKYLKSKLISAANDLNCLWDERKECIYE